MSLSDSRLAYLDCYEYLDRASEDPKGIRICCGSREAATYLRHRINHARKLHRRENAATYEKGHPMHGQSPYDVLVTRIRRDVEGEYWIYIDKRRTEDVYVESLSEDSDA